MRITSKYEGTCKSCGGIIKVGDKVEWVKEEKGVTCDICSDSEHMKNAGWEGPAQPESAELESAPPVTDEQDFCEDDDLPF